MVKIIFGLTFLVSIASFASRYDEAARIAAKITRMMRVLRA